MNSYIAVITSDIKNTRRDPTLILILLVPLLLIGVVRFGIPILFTNLPELANYQLQIITSFALLSAVFPGFILSFIILDEKDLHLLPVIKTTPVSLSGFLLARIFYSTGLSFLSSILLLQFNGMLQFQLWQLLMLGVLCALNVPFIILIISTLAKNKIEGLTLLKAANVLLFIPAAIYFIDDLWQNIFGLFPAFWVYKFIDTTFSIAVFLIGVIILLSINYQAFCFALRKLN